MLLRTRVLPAVFCVLFLAAAAWFVGCGGGGASSLFYTSGLLLPGTGPQPLPPPDSGSDTGDGGGGDQNTGGDNLCITWQNNADMDVGVMLWASASGTISFDDLQSAGNLQLLPEADEGCIDQADIQGNRVLVPVIQDGNMLSYQLPCADAASLLFGVGDENVVVTNPDDIFGVLREGVDFQCGETLPLTVTDEDQDGQPEIGT